MTTDGGTQEWIGHILDQLREIREEVRHHQDELNRERAAQRPMIERDRREIGRLVRETAMLRKQIQPIQELQECMDGWRVRVQTAAWFGTAALVLLSTLPRDSVVAFVLKILNLTLNLLPGAGT